MGLSLKDYQNQISKLLPTGEAWNQNDGSTWQKLINAMQRLTRFKPEMATRIARKWLARTDVPREKAMQMLMYLPDGAVLNAFLDYANENPKSFTEHVRRLKDLEDSPPGARALKVLRENIFKFEWFLDAAGMLQLKEILGLAGPATTGPQGDNPPDSPEGIAA